MLTVPQDVDAVHEDVRHPGGVLVRPIERRMVLDRVRVEDDNVGVIVPRQSPAPIQPPRPRSSGARTRATCDQLTRPAESSASM